MQESRLLFYPQAPIHSLDRQMSLRVTCRCGVVCVPNLPSLSQKGAPSHRASALLQVYSHLVQRSHDTVCSLLPSHGTVAGSIVVRGAIAAGAGSANKPRSTMKKELEQARRGTAGAPSQHRHARRSTQCFGPRLAPRGIVTPLSSAHER